MQQYRVEKSQVNGNIQVTTSKSHTMRAILLASMADGVSTVRMPLPSPDTVAMVAACRAFGATIEEQSDVFTITGVNGIPRVPKQIIDVGNSGQVLRFGAALAALLKQYTVITGDESVCTIRPMNPVIDALSQLDAFAVSSKGDGHAPIIIRGPAKAGSITMEGRDSQPVSAILFLGAFLDGITTINVINAGEKPWIDLTLYWLDMLGIPYTNNNYEHYTVKGPVPYKSFDYTVPGDWSSAAFPIAAALVTNSDLTINNMDINDPQGDKAIIPILQRMGANITVDKTTKNIYVKKHTGLHGIEVDVNTVIDAVPILATIACFADSPTLITGASIARHKECDRLSTITKELTKMGAHIEEFEDGLRIHPAKLYGAATESHHDHRIAMSIAIAGFSCGGVTINDTACVAKSFPGFALSMKNIGANITELGVQEK